MSADGAAPAVTAERLRKVFGSFVAVDSLSFSVPRGAIFGLLGANGAGKSTTIRMLCGLLRPTGGLARVAGCDVDKQSEQLKRRVGYMSQRFSLYNDLTVDENIAFYGGIYGLDKKRMAGRAAAALETAGLQDLRGRLAGTLSGGYKQRLALGCALLHEPEVLFLDEPTGGVDPLSRRLFWSLIGREAARGTTVIVTTHYLDEAEYCNSILLMNAGAKLAEGGPGELKRRIIPGGTFEIRCSDPVEAMERLKNLPWIGVASIFGTAIHASLAAETGDQEAAALITAELAQSGLAVDEIRRVAASMEDVFIYANASSRGEGP